MIVTVSQFRKSLPFLEITEIPWSKIPNQRNLNIKIGTSIWEPQTNKNKRNLSDSEWNSYNNPFNCWTNDSIKVYADYQIQIAFSVIWRISELSHSRKLTWKGSNLSLASLQWVVASDWAESEALRACISF